MPFPSTRPPACSITGIITQYYGVLCEAETSVHYAAIYIEVVDFISISVALMGLIVFYDLTKSELRGRRPLSKFSTIKVIVALICECSIYLFIFYPF